MDVHRIIGQNVRARRKVLGLGFEELAEAMTALGFEMSGPTVSRLETQPGVGRQIKVDELLGLAVVLDTSPVALMLPAEDVDPDGEVVNPVEFGEVSVHPLLFVWWALHRNSLEGMDNRAFVMDRPSEVTRLLGAGELSIADLRRFMNDVLDRAEAEEEAAMVEEPTNE